MGFGTSAAGLSWAFELSREAEAKAVYATEQSQNSDRHVSKVLSAMCDVVITLDSSLRITGGPGNGFAKLQHLLMLTSPEFCNKSFLDFMNSADQERFISYTDREAGSINKSEEVSTQAQSCHLHFKDRFCIPVAVQVFCSALLDYDGQPMYFLGIREDADAGLRAEQQQEALAESSATGNPEAQLIGNADSFSMHSLCPRTSPRKCRSSRSRCSNSSRRDSGGKAGSSTGTPRDFSDHIGPLRRDIARASHSRAKWNGGFEITPENSVEQIIDQGVMHLNCDAKHPGYRRCCQWHLALSALDHSLKNLMKRPCDQSYTTQYDLLQQCVECKFLWGIAQDACGMCGCNLFQGPKKKRKQ